MRDSPVCKIRKMWRICYVRWAFKCHNVFLTSGKGGFASPHPPRLRPGLYLWTLLAVSRPILTMYVHQRSFRGRTSGNVIPIVKVHVYGRHCEPFFGQKCTRSPAQTQYRTIGSDTMQLLRQQFPWFHLPTHFLCPPPFRAGVLRELHGAVISR